MKAKLFSFFIVLFCSLLNAQVTSGLVQHFKFDNSYSNVAGTTSFSTTSFDFDRSGYPNSAIRITYALQSQATIPGLPYGSAARTISFWTKSIADAGLNYGPVFSYGTATTGNAFGGGVSTDRTMIVSHNDDYTLIMPGWATNTVGVWHHFVFTYDGTTAKMYRNGQLMGSMAKSWNTINNSDIFKLGVGTGGQQYFNGLIDDLKIYDRAVTDAEATEIYNEPNTNTIGLIKSFSFNNSPADDTNTVSFTTSNASYPIAYTAGRPGAGQALVTNANATRTCTIPNLPLGKVDRTISFWYYHDQPTIATYASVGYGGSSQYNTFGFYMNASNVYFQGFSYDQAFTHSSTSPFQWYHAAIVFESENAKIYINGVLKGTIARPLLNTTLTSFRIGAFAGAVDDLKIYDRALSPSQIAELYSKPAVTVSSYPFTHNQATINYTIFDYGLNTTSVVKYGTDSNNLTNQVTGFSTTGNTNMGGFANLTGLLPNTTYYFQVEATNSSGLGTSPIMSFTTQSQAPGIYSVAASSITTNSANIDYSVWDKGLATTTLVRYGLTSGSMTNQVTGFSVSGDTTIAGNVSLSGLTPATTYYYQVEATNSAGTTTSSVTSFTTSVPPSQIANYPFNNSFNDSSGNNPFLTGSGSATFVADRNSQAAGAVRVGHTSFPLSATIPNLPIGNAERTISFWHKKPTHTTVVGLFAYGTSGNLQTFGIYLLANGNYVFQGSVTDYTFTSSATTANTWVHTVVTYKNGVVKLYNNNSLIGSANLILNTGSSLFRLGGNGAIVEFDDLQIYNYELSASQISQLFNNNVLSSSDFNQNNLQVKLYPNPVRDILNIEIENDIQSVEIYNIQGQKVLQSSNKQIETNSLNSGIYMVRIEDVNGAVATQKLIKK